MPGPRRRVELVSSGDGGWRLLRDGEPYVVRGAGLSGNLEALAAAGGNTIRTWGIGSDTRALLDEAHAAGLMVAVGIWLGHVEHGFDYGDEAAVAAQLERAQADVERLKDHPALLVWGVGNEVELEGGDDPRIWRAIEEIAAMVKAVDPDHPTMAVTAEIGEAIDARLMDLCPSVDIWGINSYGGATSLPARLTERGFTGPYMLTEFGNPGDWEQPKHPWGAAVELSSTDKAPHYRAAYDAVAADPRNIGAFAFLWGPAERPLDTWFALFGPSGLRFETADTVRALWGGAPPTDRAPTISAWETGLDGAVLEPGAAVRARLGARDPEGGTLRYDWILHRDTIKGSGPGIPLRCVEDDGADSIDWRAPIRPGPYRLMAVARDDGGGAAYASARFHVGEPAGDEARVALPTWVDGPWAPSGWMGDAPRGALAMDDCPPRPGFCTGHCRRFTYRRPATGGEGWAGVVWHHPDGNWAGDADGVPVEPGAVAIEFAAWGVEGGEVITFSAGNEDVDGFVTSERITLTATPTTYRLTMAGHRYEDVVYGFGWTARAPTDAMTFHVADVQWSAN